MAKTTVKKSKVEETISKTEEKKTATKRRRTKAEIEADKKARAEHKAELARNKAEREAKRIAREQKKVEREAKIKAKEEAAALKLKQAEENEKIKKIINKLKIGPEYSKAVPMTAKEKELCKKILSDSSTSLTMCNQWHGKYHFNILSHRTNEFLISIENTYYFYNKEKNSGINFGSVFTTWCNSCKKIPWTEEPVNIIHEDKSGNNSTPNKRVRRTKKTAR